MADCRFTNFDIAVHGQANPYFVHANYGDHAAEGELDADGRQADWVERVAQLGSPRRPPGREFLEKTGALLFQALLRDQVRDLWLRAQADLEAGTVAGLRVRLSLSPAGVVDLPWEAMYDPDRRVLFATSLRTPLVRVVNLLRYVGAVRPLATQLPLRLLVAMPEDPSGQIDAGREWQRLHEAVAPIRPEGVQMTQLAGRFDVLDLRRQLELTQADILHLVTHGRPDGVVLWQAGQPVLTPAAALRVALEAAPSVRLVVLSACATAQSPTPTPLASAGAQLLQAGVPAVIAMQFDVQADVAAAFAGHFYTELVAGRCPGAIDVAMSYARSSLYALNPHAFDYGTPVLWLNAVDGRIFTPDRAIQARRVPVTPAQPMPSTAEIAAILEEIAEIQRWLVATPGFSASTMTADDRSIEKGRQEHLRELRDSLAVAVVATAGASPTQIAAWAKDGLPNLRRHLHAADHLAAILQRNHQPLPPGA